MNRSVSIEWQKQNVEDLIAVGKIALKQGNSGVMRPASGQRDLQEGLLQTGQEHD
ncbi:hypothetical protein ACLB1R_03695 [Escherichia coli]